jgi:hypothetical protein
LVHQFSAESVNESAFLVFDLIRRSAGLERDGNARGFIHPEFDQGEGAAGRGEGMIANPRFDSGCFDAPADDPVGVLLEEGVGGKLTGLAAGGAEEIAVDVVDDAGHFEVIVQTLVEAMMAGNVVLRSEKYSPTVKFTTAPIRLKE